MKHPIKINGMEFESLQEGADHFGIFSSILNDIANQRMVVVSKSHGKGDKGEPKRQLRRLCIGNPYGIKQIEYKGRLITPVKPYVHEIVINGLVFDSIKDAATALGIKPSILQNWTVQGIPERNGFGIKSIEFLGRNVKTNKAFKNVRRKFVINGVQYDKLQDAGTAWGVTRERIRQYLKSNDEGSFKPNERVWEAYYLDPDA